jgi:hypothetical protein
MAIVPFPDFSQTMPERERLICDLMMIIDDAVSSPNDISPDQLAEDILSHIEDEIGLTKPRVRVRALSRAA